MFRSMNMLLNGVRGQAVDRSAADGVPRLSQKRTRYVAENITAVDRRQARKVEKGWIVKRIKKIRKH